MRNLSPRNLVVSSILSAAVFLILSVSAFALETEHSFTDITGLGTDGTVVGTTIEDLGPGDTFEVAIALDNSVGDDIFSIFTHLIYDNDVINIVNGFSDITSFPQEPGFGTGNFFVSLAPPEDAFGQPEGTAIGIALGIGNPTVGDGVYNQPNAGVVAIAIFEVVGEGVTDIEHVDTGASDIRNGVSPSLTVSTPLQVAAGDGVPDGIDNCLFVANGPNQGGLNQLDGDQDGYGNACDGDINNDGAADGGDFGPFIASFNTLSGPADLNGDGVTDGGDFGRLSRCSTRYPALRASLVLGRFLVCLERAACCSFPTAWPNDLFVDARSAR